MDTLKVLLVNGSPHKDGCVSTALSEIADTLKSEGIDSTPFWVGNQPVAGCIGCGACVGKRSCFRNDKVNEFVKMIDDYDGKPAAAIATCRRSGATAALDQMNKYMTDCNMPIVPSQHWNVVHGNTPEEIHRDTEGLQTMRTLARNMAWLLKCIALGREHGIEFPAHEQHTMTNFIR